MKKNIFKKNSLIVSRVIADETILVPIGKESRNLKYLFVLEGPVAKRIWELIDGKKTLQEIKEAILEEFEVEVHNLERDLQEFIQQLKEIRAIIPQ